MIEVPVYNQTGQKIDTIQVDEAKLGGEVRTNLLKQALVMYHANQRQGTVHTQARGEVAGSTRKMFRQKGTGNARTGGIRNPIKKGGGHAKQKRPRTGARPCPRRPAGSPRDSAILLARSRATTSASSTRSRSTQPKTKLVAADVQGPGHRPQLPARADRPRRERSSARPATSTARR